MLINVNVIGRNTRSLTDWTSRITIAFDVPRYSGCLIACRGYLAIGSDASPITNVEWYSLPKLNQVSNTLRNIIIMSLE